MAAVPQASSVDCPDHAPPPDPCPSEGTAKHAASACCPMMSGAVALLQCAGRHRGAGFARRAHVVQACAVSSAASSPRIHRLPASEPISSVHPSRHGEASCCSDVRSSASWRGQQPRRRRLTAPAAMSGGRCGRSRQGHAHHRGRGHRERLFAEVARRARRRDGALRRAQRRHGSARAHHRHGRRACRASQA